MFVQQNRPDIIGLTETWLYNSIDEAELGFPDYTLFRQDRTYSVGGGVALLVHNSIQSVARPDISKAIDFPEMIWSQLTTGNNESILVGCIYRAPTASDINNMKLSKVLEFVSNIPVDHLLIVGDFNIPHVDWTNNKSTAGNGSIDFRLHKSINDSYLFQHVNFATRDVFGQKPATLDLLLTRDEQLVDSISRLPPIGSSDHCCIVCQLSIEGGMKQIQTVTKDWAKADFDSIRSELASTDWNEELSEMSAENLNGRLVDRIEQLMKRYVPTRVVKGGQPLRWETRRSRRLVLRKAAAYRKYQQSRSYRDYAAYAVIRNKVTDSIRQGRKVYESKIAESCNRNPKKLFAYIRSKTKSRGKITINKPDGQAAAGSSETAEVLNDYFSSVFTRESNGPVPNFDERLTDDKYLLSVNFVETDITAKLLKLDPGKSPGPDSIYPRLLRECALELAAPLKLLFSRSMSEGYVPSGWKRANVIPIFKKGDKHDPDNYRPISLTSILSKIMETIIKESVFTHLNSNSLFSTAQYGFRSKRSCVLQLLEAMELWTEALDRGLPVDVAYLDFKKAFDSVPHRRLLKKISAYGIKGRLLAWIEDFLTGRQQRVRIDEVHSRWSNIISGVPQGSVLGPLLFLNFINDLPDSIVSCIKLFADDTKVYTAISDCTKINEMSDDLQRLMDWSDKWQLGFNTRKCVMMHLGKHNPASIYQVQSNGVTSTLRSSTEERDLGVIIDPQLTFSNHIDQITNKANRQLGMIRRTLVIRDARSLLSIYKATVRPILEYASPVWSPWKRKDIDSIEHIQRRFTKLVAGTDGLTYEQRLVKLDLPTLAFRRHREQLIQVYKLLNNHYDTDHSKFLHRQEFAATRGHSAKLQIVRPRLAGRANFFSVRIIQDWNSLPESVIASSTVNQFKNQLKKHFGKEQFRLK